MSFLTKKKKRGRKLERLLLATGLLAGAGIAHNIYDKDDYFENVPAEVTEVRDLRYNIHHFNVSSSDLDEHVTNVLKYKELMAQPDLVSKVKKVDSEIIDRGTTAITYALVSTFGFLFWQIRRSDRKHGEREDEEIKG